MSSPSGSGGGRITIKSISCRGVRAFVPFQKPPLYAAVSLGDRREKTPPDADGGENPDWEDAVFAFDLDGDQRQQQLAVVEFEVKAQVPLLGNKLVGTASVPVADLAAAAGSGGAGDGAALRHISYQVSGPDGKPNGTLTFAYAISGGGLPQPQIYPARPDQNPSFCCAPPASAAYPPAPAPPNFAAGYPPQPSPPASASLYPPLQDLLSPSSYPPAPTPNPLFPTPNSSSYPPPATADVTAYPPPPAEYTSYPPPPQPTAPYPPPPASCAACPPPPPAQYASYPPPPGSSNYPPAPPSGYPPPLAPNSTHPGSTYPPPAAEPSSGYPVYPRSERSLPYYSAPPGDSYYPPPGTRHSEVDGAARAAHYYPPPGTRYP